MSGLRITPFAVFGLEGSALWTPPSITIDFINGTSITLVPTSAAATLMANPRNTPINQLVLLRISPLESVIPSLTWDPEWVFDGDAAPVFTIPGQSYRGLFVRAGADDTEMVELSRSMSA